MQQLSFLEGPLPGEFRIPTGGKPTRCASCGAAIVWGTTSRGNPIPLDLNRVRAISGDRYALTHFATCPQGRDWRIHG